MPVYCLADLINLALAVDFGTVVDVGVKESKRNILVAADNLKRASQQFLLFWDNFGPGLDGDYLVGISRAYLCFELPVEQV